MIGYIFIVSKEFFLINYHVEWTVWVNLLDCVHAVHLLGDRRHNLGLFQIWHYNHTLLLLKVDSIPIASLPNIKMREIKVALHVSMIPQGLSFWLFVYWAFGFYFFCHWVYSSIAFVWINFYICILACIHESVLL